jgi:hypothetical protein
VSQRWVERLHRIVRRGAVDDLARPLLVGAPRYPSHPPYLYAMMKRHGDAPYAGSVSSATDLFTMSCHGGTHVDALCHFARDGRLHGGVPAVQVQDLARGFAALDVPALPLAPRRGVLLDVAAYRGVPSLGPATWPRPRTWRVRPPRRASPSSRATPSWCGRAGRGTGPTP